MALLSVRCMAPYSICHAYFSINHPDQISTQVFAMRTPGLQDLTSCLALDIKEEKSFASFRQHIHHSIY